MSPTPDTTAFAAAVLAGGRAIRMGADKAFLPWRGQRLLDRQLSVLRALGPAELLVSGRPGVDYNVAGVHLVLDHVADQGPLGGLAAVLEATTASHVVLLAVDLPAMTPGFLRRMLAHRRPGVGAVARTASGWEPLAAVYPREILPLVRERLARHELALHFLLSAAVAGGWLLPVEATADDLRLLTNLNTPADIAAHE